jgi:hypothetical protein
MRFIPRGPAVLALLLLAGYAAFVTWYGGSGPKLTRGEKSLLFARITSNAGPGDATLADGRMMQHLRDLADDDDGREFFMLYLMRFKDHDTAQTADAMAADRENNLRVAPILLRHGNVPVFIGEPQGRFLDEQGDIEWQRVVMVRYRSRRDLLEMMADIAGKPIGVLRWAQIEHQQVFPVHARINLFMARGLIFMVFAGFGLLLHLLLRLWPRYRGITAAAG